MRQSVLIGNWKMHSPLPAFAGFWAGGGGQTAALPEIIVCPPALVLEATQAAAGSRPIAWGAQAIAPLQSGARTGDLSASMFRAAGATYCLVGHSERRLYHRETEADAAAQMTAAWEGGLTPILCIGEDLEAREAGRTLHVLREQLAVAIPVEVQRAFYIAYEPLWSIGTGKIPTTPELEAVFEDLCASCAHRFKGDVPPLLYGGSVTRANAEALWHIPHVSGLLVGGASLDPETFYAIAALAPQKEAA